MRHSGMVAGGLVAWRHGGMRHGGMVACRGHTRHLHPVPHACACAHTLHMQRCRTSLSYSSSSHVGSYVQVLNMTGLAMPAYTHADQQAQHRAGQTRVLCYSQPPSIITPYTGAAGVAATPSTCYCQAPATAKHMLQPSLITRGCEHHHSTPHQRHIRTVIKTYIS